MRLLQKLIVGNLIGIAIFAVALLWLEDGVERAKGELDQIIEETLPVRDALQDLRYLILSIVSSTREKMFLATVSGEIGIMEGVEVGLQTEKSLIEKVKSNYNSTFLKYENIITEYFPDEIEEMRTLRDQGNAVFSLVDQIWHLTNQKASPEELFEVKEQLEDAETNFLATIKSTLQYEKEEIVESREALENSMLTNAKLSIVLVFSAFLVIIGTSIYFCRSQIIRIRKLNNATQEIADGKLIQIVTDDAQDELGSLSRNFGNMTDKLQVVQKTIIQHRDHLQELVDAATKELKANATELELALAKEQELNKLQREFVSMASHEFRTPLAIIDATAQRMKSRAAKNRLTPEDAIARVEKIRDAVKRMTRLMESTLDAARMEEGKINIEIGECDLQNVLLEVLTNQIELSPSHNITCDLQELPDMIQGDSGALTQVFANLLSNAVKYAPDAPDIEIKANIESDQVVISVRDHGMGIDEDELGRIGERFFRAKTSTGIAGTGIGLNLAKRLVTMHGGTINVESKKGEGSTFKVRLPIARPNQSEQADTRAA